MVKFFSRQADRNKKKHKDFEKLGRALESIFEGGYMDHRRVYKINFVRGVFFGFGVFVGGTIVVALLLWILGLFTEIPLIGEFSETVRDSIEEQ
ncbi:MAG: DUF5665 domain-containing protein [Candidatus Saccharimonadales bacterium]|nr:DUF5665 domain-containing protein [Candidatus Saccharimonadales bacterium]